MSDITWDEFPVEEDNLPKYSQERVRRQTEVKVDPEAKQRIKKWMMWCMLSVAALIDIVQILLALVGIGDLGGDSIISVGADFAFVTWFWILGVSFTSNSKRLATTTIQAIIEAIPIIQVLPILTIAVYINCRLTRAEDALKK